MIVRWFYGELVVLDLSETGTQLGEKLSLLLDDKQQKELAHYLLGDMVSTIGTRKNLSNYNRQQKNPLTEIREGDLYICLEHRLVMIREQEIILTVTDQGEHMGISASAYEKWTKESLDLKDNEIYVVYQRERSERNYLGIDFGTKKPRIYMGEAKDDLWQYVAGVPTPSNKFDTSFNIVGEEEKILTGVFGNKISEHIIVFSDSYYQKVCNRVEGPNLIVMVQIPKNYEKVIEEICAYTNGSGIVYEKKNLLLQISKTKIINVSAAIINIFVLLICSFFVLSIKMECDFPEQKGKYIFYSQGGMTHRNIRKSIMKESFWTGGIPIIFGVVISTIFMGTEVYLKKLSLEWIKQYAVKLMGTITGIIFLFLFISICFGIRNIIRIEREE